MTNNIPAKKNSCGLLGRSLKHSFSPEIHHRIAELTGIDYSYVIYEKEPEEVEAFVKEGDWTGLNVTIPYKETVMEFCDEIAPEAREIGAVNTLVKRDGKIFGYNTDYYGFRRSLEVSGVEIAGKKTIVLGSGGASKAVSKALKDWVESEQGSYRDTCPSNFWDDITVPFWSMPENTAHPTQKPEKLLAKLILASSNPGDTVLDPFLGSGTTSVTAKKLDRHYIGIELEPRYCVWAEQRLERAETDCRIQGYDGVFTERNF